MAQDIEERMPVRKARVFVVAACPGNSKHRKELRRFLRRVLKGLRNSPMGANQVQVHSEIARADAAADVIGEAFGRFCEELEPSRSKARILNDLEYFKDIARRMPLARRWNVRVDGFVVSEGSYKMQNDVTPLVAAIFAFLQTVRGDCVVRVCVAARMILRAMLETGKYSKSVTAACYTALESCHRRLLLHLTNRTPTLLDEPERRCRLIVHGLTVLENRLPAEGLQFARFLTQRDEMSEKFDCLGLFSGSDAGEALECAAMEEAGFTLTGIGARGQVLLKDYVECMLNALLDERELTYMFAQEVSFRALADIYDEVVYYYGSSEREGQEVLDTFIPEDIKGQFTIRPWGTS